MVATMVPVGRETWAKVKHRTGDEQLRWALATNGATAGKNACLDPWKDSVLNHYLLLRPFGPLSDQQQATWFPKMTRGRSHLCRLHTRRC
jgi:hypothetical protein